ncbi:hypothetical protein MP638_005529 [Amoeboaphelidium occidentale]|nr:hypothetical protein MP638_005529 [Amoeboaphelidium occidentale]
MTKSETKGPRVIVILENAPLEIVKNAKSKSNPYQLLTCDDHASLLKKYNRTPNDMRPDITHQCLLTLLDSPLNKAQKLKVYIRTQKNVLIDINPQTRIPRTFKRFAGLMVQLLHRLSIKSTSGDILMKVIKNPIEQYLPVGCKKIVLSGDAKATVKMNEYAKSFDKEESVCFIVGAFASGADDFADSYCDEKISVSQFPLSASVACSKLCNAFEDLYDIV